jgi:predicted nuclease of predicted toxin-antitoxin system
MRVLCDVHIPYRLVNRLRELGVDATHVNRILDGSETTDAAIAAFVDANEMLFITKDGDFRDSHFLRGVPARVLRLTLGNLSNTELIALLESHWGAILESCGTDACYLELSLEGIFRSPRSL